MRVTASYTREILSRLRRRYSKDMRTYLYHSNPWELLVATILSAQAQDKQVNKITAKLFKAYKSPADYAALEPKELYPYIKSIGLYRNKGKNIIKASRLLTARFNSRVPRTIAQLITLPGVGRKTANVVISNAYGINEGMAIDTHCITVTNRLGLARSKDPVKIEKRMLRLFPQKEWSNVSHLFIALGRDTCTARVKYCERCVLKDICPSSTVR
ncbi:MAG: endonuclease III [Candidatus Micrarchaeota archaeon]|nr:endonuclease III [Candidatus Micrarchaeota archaeon]